MLKTSHFVVPIATLCAALVAISSIGATVAPGTVQAAPSAVAVQIKGFKFSPAMLTIAPGTTVTWTNADDEAHTVTSTTRAFHSTALDTGDRYSFTFTRTGDFAYFCSLHPHMTGKITVK